VWVSPKLRITIVNGMETRSASNGACRRVETRFDRVVALEQRFPEFMGDDEKYSRVSRAGTVHHVTMATTCNAKDGRADGKGVHGKEWTCRWRFDKCLTNSVEAAGCIWSGVSDNGP
jgi:hypothetical protein